MANNADLYLCGPPEGLERLYHYEEGGHHPVHLDDILNDRYKVLHKLGYGGFATVWLCRDMTATTPTYVAVRIIMDEDSDEKHPEFRLDTLGLDMDSEGWKHIVKPLAQFKIDGPNGTHIAMVLPVLGPRAVKSMPNSDKQADGKIWRRICLQAVQVMFELHKHGLCHGDFRPANILLGISGLNGLPEEEVLEMLGQPRKIKVKHRGEGEHNNPAVPQYLVYPIDWNIVAKQQAVKDMLTFDAFVIDFGELYETNSPPEHLGIPDQYRPPELLLKEDVKPGTGADLWALGCTLYEIRTGHTFINPTFDLDPDDMLCEIVFLLGKLPAPLWEKFEYRRFCFTEELQENGRPVETEDKDEDEDDPSPRSILEKLLRKNKYYLSRVADPITNNVDESEAAIFADLLEKILRYAPEDRLSAKEVLEHPWFKL